MARFRPESVLEIAAGTGAVTRELASALSPSAKITATDLNSSMLEYAQELLPDSRITWKKVDALSIPFADESFDVVVCQFGAMFFPDRVRAYKEARRVLKPSGRFLFNVWDQISENDVFHFVEENLTFQFPKNPPRFFSRTPYAYYDSHQISQDLKLAGFSKTSFETIKFMTETASAETAALALCQGTPVLNEIASQDPSKLDQATQFVAKSLKEKFGNGPIKSRISALEFIAER